MEEVSYSKTNPDSYDAFYKPDPGEPDELVEIKDDFLTFTWERKKSNENLIDQREGKGFSFYLARHAYYDKYKLPKDSLAYDKKNTGMVAQIQLDKKYTIVINVKPNLNTPKKIHIVSAYYTDSPTLIDEYEAHKAQMIAIEKAIERRSNEKIKKIGENIIRRQEYLDNLREFIKNNSTNYV